LFRPLRQLSAANLWDSVGLICSPATVPKLFLPPRQYRARESMGQADGLARPPGEELHKLCLRLRRSTAENLSQLDGVICCSALILRLCLLHRRFAAREGLGTVDGLARSLGEELHKLCLRLRRSTAENLSQLGAVVC
jgi:hypothetical protein